MIFRIILRLNQMNVIVLFSCSNKYDHEQYDLCLKKYFHSNKYLGPVKTPPEHPPTTLADDVFIIGKDPQPVQIILTNIESNFKNCYFRRELSQQKELANITNTASLLVFHGTPVTTKLLL